MYAELTNAQSKAVLDAEQLFSAYKDTSSQLAEYRGGMHWKTVKGREYLYKTLDRNGNAKSIGARSLESEAIYRCFVARKVVLKARHASLLGRMQTQEKISAAHRIGHVPNDMADICIELAKFQLMGSNLMVIGTNAMHAYAAMTGVRFDDEIMATTDVDLLWSHKSRLSLLATSEVKVNGLIGVLKKADKTFEVKSDQPFRAVSQSGFMVDLIRQTPTPPWRNEPDRFSELIKDLVATDIGNMDWMLSAPKILQPVVALNGKMFDMVSPDPRAFVLFKFWLSQSPERDPRKKPRDLAQALQVARLIEDKLPYLNDSWGSMQSFPKEVIDQALGLMGCSGKHARSMPGE